MRRNVHDRKSGVKPKVEKLPEISASDFRKWEEKVAEREGRTLKKKLHPWLPANLDMKGKRK